MGKCYMLHNIFSYLRSPETSHHYHFCGSCNYSVKTLSLAIEINSRSLFVKDLHIFLKISTNKK